MRASNPPVLPPSPPPPPQPPSPSPPSPPPTIALQPAPLLAPLHRHHRRPCCDHHHTSTPFTTRLPQHSHHYSCCEHHHHEHTLRCMTTTAVPLPTPLQKAPRTRTVKLHTLKMQTCIRTSNHINQFTRRRTLSHAPTACVCSYYK